jgi:uncharacterized protein YdhG (YjbR/CyaY superfamily)
VGEWVDDVVFALVELQRNPAATRPAGRARCLQRDRADRRLHEMAERPTAGSIEEYIAGFPPETQEVLKELRALIRATAPDAIETISYAMPTFDLNGKHLVHFAGFKHHVGLYPMPSGIEAFRAELGPYKNAKGSVQFPLGKPMPWDLVRRIVEYRVRENARKTSE